MKKASKVVAARPRAKPVRARRAQLIMPSVAENREIRRGIAADSDTYVPSDAEFARMKPVRGRPKGSGSRVRLTVRLDRNVVSRLRATGPGWQTRLNDLLVRAAERAR